MPMTPKTTSHALSHYFDDTFSRHAKSPSAGGRIHLRRSSSSRSIGARSDFEAKMSMTDTDGETDIDTETDAVILKNVRPRRPPLDDDDDIDYELAANTKRNASQGKNSEKANIAELATSGLATAAAGLGISTGSGGSMFQLGGGDE